MARNIKVKVSGNINNIYPGNQGFIIHMLDGQDLMARLSSGDDKTLSENISLSQSYEISGHVDLFDENNLRSEFILLVDSIEDIKPI